MKQRYTKILVAVFAVVFISAFVFAARPETMPDKARNSFALPENAVEVSPGVFYLGKSMDKGRVVEGYAMFAKPVTKCGNGICEPGENARKCPADCSAEDPTEPDTSSCYTFLSKGAKWKTIEPYLVDPANTRGVDDSFVRSNLATNIGKWETAAGVNILGDEILEGVNRETIGSLNGANEVMFADIDYEGAIAVAIVWGYFSGNPAWRELVEWDMVFDDTDFDWSAIGEAGKMDFENIATHELGHAVGLGDLYNDECSEQTMYGISWNGDITKRTLESGDISGIQELY